MKKLFYIYNNKINKEKLKIIAIEFKRLNSIVRFLITINAFDININNFNIRFII